jgi:hypothetical protein
VDNVADDWTGTWSQLVSRVGCDLIDGAVTWGADPVERSSVRRYLEPLEFDCALHYDPDIARANGFDDVIAPYTSAITYVIPATWAPGQRVFTSDERDAQPAVSAIDGGSVGVPPGITGFFATDMDLEFLRPPTVGERLGRRGNVLKACVPKWISVGRGAFLTFESEIITAQFEVIARMRNMAFAYEPVGPPPVADVVGAAQ